MAAQDLQVIVVGICYKNILQDLDINMQTPALNLLFILCNTVIPMQTLLEIMTPRSRDKTAQATVCPQISL